MLASQASGVKVSEEVKNRFDEIKRKKNLRYLIFYIKDEKTICIEKAGKYFLVSNVCFALICVFCFFSIYSWDRVQSTLHGCSQFLPPPPLVH